MALAQIGVPPPVARQCTVAELDVLIAGIDQMNKEAKAAEAKARRAGR